MTISEEDMVDGCIRKEKRMQEFLYRKYAGSMLAVASRYVKMQQEAEDIIQESFIKVFKHMHTYRRDSSLLFWIKRIVINTALNQQRRKLYLFPMVDVYELKQKPIAENALSDFSYQELLEMIQELPDGCRIIFNLHAIEGFKHHEIAEMLQISEGTSKSQFSRARQLLQIKLEKREHERYGQAGKA